VNSQQYDSRNPLQEGCIIGYPNDVYHAAVDENGFPIISSSKLFMFHQRPRLFQGTYVTAEVERPVTDALVTGSAGHAFLLEGESEFLKQFATIGAPLKS